MTRNVVNPARTSVPMVEPAAVTWNCRSIQLSSARIALLFAAIFPSLAAGDASRAGHPTSNEVLTPGRGKGRVSGSARILWKPGHRRRASLVTLARWVDRRDASGHLALGGPAVQDPVGGDDCLPRRESPR